MSIVRRAAHAAPLALLLFGFASHPAMAQEPSSYARIERSDTTLRCFPTSYSPVYGETLAEGEIVVPADDERNGFVAVRLPLGVPGFLHADYAEVGDDGVVKSTGSRVAFRYRPSSGEAPILLVDEGTEFRLLAIEGSWLKVRFPDQPAWIPSDAAVVFPAAEAVDTVVAGWRSHGERQEQQVVEAVARLEADRAAVAKLDEQRERLDTLTAQFGEEIAKDDAEQDLTAVRDATAALVDDTPEGSELRGDASQLLSEIERQARALAMVRILAEKPPEARPTVEPAVVEVDPLGDHATGWLRVSGGLFSARRYTLEKGGQVLFELECKTGRYTLDVFEGLEVAVRGPAVRPDPESMRHLDVHRIEVLAKSKG